MSARSIPLPPIDDPLTLQSVFAFVRRRRAVLTAFIVLAMLGAILTCLFATRRYRATCEIQVQKEDGGAFGLENTVTGQSAATNGDSLDYALTLQTEASILRSPAVATAVLASQHLERTSDYFAPAGAGALSASWADWLPWHTSLEPLTIPFAAAPKRRYAAEQIFASHLKVQPLAGTRLIDISYTDRDPERAASVANAIAATLAELAFEQRMSAALQGSTWLTGQIHDLRERAEQAQTHAATLQRGTGLFGSDASRNVVLERLDSLNQTLTAAESNRILKESIDRVAASGSPELISSLSGNSSSGSVASVNTSLSLIQGLRQQEAQARAELAEDSVRYGPAYPKIGELQAELAGIDNSIQAETTRLGQRAHTDWQIARQEEEGARAAFEKQKQLASRQNDSVIAYELARREADSSRDLYEGILAKLKQTSLLEGLQANNVSVVSAAEAPPADRPASPNIPLRLGGGLAAGLFFGLSTAVFLELNDTSIQSLAQVERSLGVPLLAVLPSVEPVSFRRRQRRQALTASGENAGMQTPPAPRDPVALPVVEHRLSVFSEGLRSLRTSLQLSGGGASPRVILVTSSVAGEGKTTVAANLAVLLAQGGSRVLLVDADLRRPALRRYAKDIPSAGLAMALLGRVQMEPRLLLDSLLNLHLLAGEEVPAFPSELLGSARMEELVKTWKTEYDMVVLDSPPVLPVTDAVLLSRLSDAILLVARHKRTTHQALRRGVEILQKQGEGCAPIGIVLNDVARGTGEFHQYFGYKGKGYGSRA